MSKKNKYFILANLFMMLIFTYGCGKNSSLQSKGKTAVNVDLESKIEISSIGEEQEDTQSYWGQKVHEFAKGEAGYYYITIGPLRYLMYFDETTKTSYPVCGKADCNHDNVDCNAFIGDSQHYNRKEKPRVSYAPSTVYEYQGYLYLLSDEGNLVRFALDGSSRQIVAKVFTYDESTSTKLAFHSDNVYVYNSAGTFTESGQNTESIECYSLDGKTHRTIVSYTGANVAINSVKSYGNYLFFTMSSVAIQNTDNSRSYDFEYNGLYAYNYETGEIGKLIDAQVADFFADEKENTVSYFVSGDGLYKYQLSDKKTEKIFDADAESGIVDISYDGKYIYLYNGLWAGIRSSAEHKIPRQCLILSREGKLVNTISVKDGGFCYFGDENYLFAEIVDKTLGKTYVGYINKTNIETAKDWMELPDWPR